MIDDSGGVTGPPTCPVCQHAAHSGYAGCSAFVDRPTACGCTFDVARFQRGEADVLTGRTQSLEDVMRKLRERGA